MSRYLLLFLLNAPFVFAAILSATTQYKLGRISRRRFTIQSLIWVTVIIGLILAEPLYVWLLSNGWTDTESLSLFDVVQITGIVLVFYLANRTRAKVEVLETRLRDLHQELSIKLSHKER